MATWDVRKRRFHTRCVSARLIVTLVLFCFFRLDLVKLHYFTPVCVTGKAQANLRGKCSDIKPFLCVCVSFCNWLTVTVDGACVQPGESV